MFHRVTVWRGEMNLIGQFFFNIREVICKAQLEIIALSGKKLNSEFPDAQFKIDGYHFPPFLKDCEENRGGLLIFVRNDIITRRLQDFDPKDLECVCIELTLSKKKWAICSIYRPQSENISGFLDKLANSTECAINTYDNVVIMGDINKYSGPSKSRYKETL